MHSFYHFKWSRLQSQIYGFVLIVNSLIIAVELPFTLYFLHKGTVYSESICSGWITLNYSLFELSILLMVWTSIERYLFIYHERFILRHIILFHYGPTIVLTLYCSVLYVGIVVVHTCQPAYNVYLYICGGPCYSSEQFLGMFDWIGNGVIMQFGILVINVILILRHLVQRHRMKQSVVTAARRQQWVRRCCLNFSMYLLIVSRTRDLESFLFCYTIAPISEIVYATDRHCPTLCHWLDSILNHCSHTNVSVF